MKKGKVLTIKELKSLNDGDLIHLEYYNDEGERVCNGIKKLNITINEHGTWYDADCYTIKTNELDYVRKEFVDFPDDTLLKNIDNSGYKFTVCEVIK